MVRIDTICFDLTRCRTFQKKAERFYKAYILRNDPDGLSAMPPKPYMIRFQQKMSQILGVSTLRPGRESEHDENQVKIQSALLDAVDPRGTITGASVYTPDNQRSAPLVVKPVTDST